MNPLLLIGGGLLIALGLLQKDKKRASISEDSEKLSPPTLEQEITIDETESEKPVSSSSSGGSTESVDSDIPD